MTGKDIMDACEKWMKAIGLKPILAERKAFAAKKGEIDGMEDWLRAAFVAGVEAAEAPWKEELVNAERLEQWGKL